MKTSSNGRAFLLIAIASLLGITVTACSDNPNGPAPAVDHGTYILQPAPAVAASDTSKLVLYGDASYTIHIVGKADETGAWSMPTPSTIIIGGTQGTYEDNTVTVTRSNTPLVFKR
jgi:hypothetical protein